MIIKLMLRIQQKNFNKYVKNAGNTVDFKQYKMCQKRIIRKLNNDYAAHNIVNIINSVQHKGF